MSVDRPIGRVAWSVSQARCADCCVRVIEIATLGLRKVLLTAQIGEQSIEDDGDRVQPVLVGTEPLAVSEPGEGADSNLP